MPPAPATPPPVRQDGVTHLSNNANNTSVPDHWNAVKWVEIALVPNWTGFSEPQNSALYMGVTIKIAGCMVCLITHLW